MKFTLKLGLVVGALAISASPAFAAPTPGPHAGLPAKAHAYGQYCADQSRKPVEGAHGTPFSLCVTSMAKLANDHANNPRTACQAESKKHVAGTPGTPFSNCVKGAAQLQDDLGGDTGDTGDTDTDDTDTDPGDTVV